LATTPPDFKQQLIMGQLLEIGATGTICDRIAPNRMDFFINVDNSRSSTPSH